MDGKQKIYPGSPPPVRKRKRASEPTKSKKRKGRGFVYPQGLLNQFVGSGIILE